MTPLSGVIFHTKQCAFKQIKYYNYEKIKHQNHKIN